MAQEERPGGLWQVLVVPVGDGRFARIGEATLLMPARRRAEYVAAALRHVLEERG